MVSPLQQRGQGLEAPLGESTSVWLSKLPRVTLNVGVPGRAEAEARVGLEESWRERDHREGRAGAGSWLPEAASLVRSHDFPPPARLQGTPPQFSDLKVEGHGHVPGGTKEKPWIYTQSMDYHFGQVYLHQISTKKQAVKFYKHSYPAQNERGILVIARL